MEKITFTDFKVMVVKLAKGEISVEGAHKWCAEHKSDDPSTQALLDEWVRER